MDLDKLKDVCGQYLDNADLDVALNSKTGTITLHFTVGGSLGKVVVRCARFWRFRYAKLGADADGVFVGGTQVSCIDTAEAVRDALKGDGREIEEEFRPQRLYRVKTKGGAMLDILCEGLEWEMQPGEHPA